MAQEATTTATTTEATTTIEYIYVLASTTDIGASTTEAIYTTASIIQTYAGIFIALLVGFMSFTFFRMFIT